MDCNWCNRVYVWWINRHIRKEEANIRSSHEHELQRQKSIDRAPLSPSSSSQQQEEQQRLTQASPTSEERHDEGSGDESGRSCGYGAVIPSKPATSPSPCKHDDDFYKEGGGFYSTIKSSEVEFFSHERGEFFVHTLGEEVFMYEQPTASSALAKPDPLEVATVFAADERIQRGERLFFRLCSDPNGSWGDGGGDGGLWVRGGVGLQVEQAIEEIGEPYFMYRVCDGYRLHARSEASLEAKKLSRVLEAGELFEECQQRRHAGGQVFLRLPDLKGWVCKLTATGERVLDRVPFPPRRVRAKIAIAARVMPDIFSGRTGKTFEPDAEFGISRRIAADDKMQVFYKLADGEGWVFKHSAQGEQMLTELQPPVGAEDCVIM